MFLTYFCLFEFLWNILLWNIFFARFAILMKIFRTKANKRIIWCLLSHLYSHYWLNLCFHSFWRSKPLFMFTIFPWNVFHTFKLDIWHSKLDVRKKCFVLYLSENQILFESNVGTIKENQILWIVNKLIKWWDIKNDIYYFRTIFNFFYLNEQYFQRYRKCFTRKVMIISSRILIDFFHKFCKSYNNFHNCH